MCEIRIRDGCETDSSEEAERTQWNPLLTLCGDHEISPCCSNASTTAGIVAALRIGWPFHVKWKAEERLLKDAHAHGVGIRCC